MLSAIALFQADPKKIDALAAVRCIASGDGLYLAAVNGTSAAVGRVDLLDITRVGPFSLTPSQVKTTLAVFNRKLPKDTHPDEYVLDVHVTDDQATITNVSKLFGGDSLTLAIQNGDTTLDHGEQSETQRVLAAFSTLAAATANDHPHDLTNGIHFSATEITRLGRAAAALGVEVSLRTLGRRLVAPLTADAIAFTVGTLRTNDKEKPPYRDERSLHTWRDRLQDLENGAL